MPIVKDPLDAAVVMRRRFEHGVKVLLSYTRCGEQEGRVMVPFVPGAVQDRNAANGELQDGGGQRGLGADGAEE